MNATFLADNKGLNWVTALVNGRELLQGKTPSWGIFFNISIKDLFLFADKSTLCDYGHNDTRYTSRKNSNTVIIKLNQDFSKLIIWFL